VLAGAEAEVTGFVDVLAASSSPANAGPAITTASKTKMEITPIENFLIQSSSD
jgi:hypothetical protein